VAGKIEKVKGKAKETVGGLTGNKIEGSVDKAERKTLKAIDKAKDTARRK
jgi:uncharacterized protein YjbJ (UPF0337 family)